MKRRLYLIIILAAIALSGMAQNIGEAFYIYRNDGQFNAFFRDEVISMEYSYEDADGNTYDEIVTQIINTADSVYKIPLAAIDSVSFVQPETIYNSQVIRMEPMLPYIISVDSLNITFSSTIPSNLIPKVGDVILHDSFDSELIPKGFAGRVIQCSGQQVVCEAVSFEDVYEQIVCYSRYTAVDDGTDNSMHLVRNKITGNIFTAINIGGTLGSTGSGLYGSLNGKLGLDLRVTFKFCKGKDPYFDLSISPDLRVIFGAGVRGSFSHNFLSNKVNLFSMPIPDTPFLLKLKGGPALTVSLKASISITTEAVLGYKFGVKYENGEFKGYGHNTSEWFSMPDVNGNISGSLFAGVQTEFGIYSYGDLLSLSIEKEAGAEFVANLTEDLMNSDKYEELQNAQFDLNLKASIGVVAKARFYKWASASAKLTLLSGKLNINSWKLVPTFQKPLVTVNNDISADISVKPSEKILFPVSIGLGVWDDEGELFDAQYCPNTYRVFENWGLSQFQTTFTGLTPDKNYTVNPLIKLFGKEIKASPSEAFIMKAFPVTLSDFKVTKSQYQKNGFNHEGVNYDYCFNVTVTATLDDDAKDIADWGYVYRDPYGREKEISLVLPSGYGNTYTDARWAYYRNKAKSTCTLYGYVKYAGSDETVYGELHDYPLEYKGGETTCPDSNHPHWIDLGIGTQWQCCNEGASSPEDYGDYYTFDHAQAYNLPSLDQINALCDKCTSVWTQQNGVNGRKYTGPNGGTIFFPAAGAIWYGTLRSVGMHGCFWSSTPYREDGGYYLYIKSDYEGGANGPISLEQSVRPVR